MKRFTLILLLLITACDSGIVVHDETRAAELIVDFLSAIKTEQGVGLAYAWTDDQFKETISAGEFSRIVASIRDENQGRRIRLQGYEIFGPVEIMNVYAASAGAEVNLFFRFTLSGSKSGDYYLLQLDVGDTAFARQGVYQEYAESIGVDGV